LRRPPGQPSPSRHVIPWAGPSPPPPRDFRHAPRQASPKAMPAAPPLVEDVLTLAPGAEEELLAPGHPKTVARLRALGPRLGEALDWGAEHDPERGLALASALWRYWVLSGELREGRQHLGWLLSLVPNPSPVRLAGLTGRALLASFAGEHADAKEAAEEAIPLAEFDVAALESRIKDAEEDLVLAKTDAERARIAEALDHMRILRTSV